MQLLRFIDITDTRKLYTLPQSNDVIPGNSDNSDTENDAESEENNEKDIDHDNSDNSHIQSPRLPVMYQISKKQRTKDDIRRPKRLEGQQENKHKEAMSHMHKNKYIASEAVVDTGANSCGIDMQIINDYCDTKWQKAHLIGYSIVDSTHTDKSRKRNYNDNGKSEDTKKNESENDKNNNENLDQTKLKPVYEMKFHVMDSDDKPLTINTFPIVGINSNVIGGAELKHLMQTFEYGESNCILHHKKDYKTNELYFANGERVTRNKYLKVKRQWKQGESRSHGHRFRVHMANMDMRPKSKVLERIGLLRYEQLRKRKEKKNEKRQDKEEDKNEDKDLITEDDIWPVLQAQLEFHGHLPHLKQDFEKYKHLLFKPTNAEILSFVKKR